MMNAAAMICSDTVSVVASSLHPGCDEGGGCVVRPTNFGFLDLVSK